MMNLNFFDQMILSLQQKVTDLDKKLLLFFLGKGVVGGGGGGGEGEWMGRLVKKDNRPY